MAKVTFNVVVTCESDGSFWAEVKELPGCFASGFSMDEVKEATFEAIQLWLPDGIKLEAPTWEVVGDDDAPRKKPSSRASAAGKKRPAKGRRKRVLVSA